MNMKQHRLIISLALIAALMVACAPGANLDAPYSPVEFATAAVPADHMPFVLADTITPPANPMAPEDISSFPTYAGTLQLFPAYSFNNLNGCYFCGIQLQTPIEVKVSDYRTYCYSSLYLLDNESKELVQFDHPLLQSCVVGDSIFVTGTPVIISNRIAMGIEMRYVQPLHQ